MSSAKRAIAVLIAVAVIVAVVIGLALGSVRGTVVNPENGKPITNAVVVVNGRTAKIEAGRFRVRAPAGLQEFSATAPGHEKVISEVWVWPFFGSSMGVVRLRDATVVLKVVESYPGAFDVRTTVTVKSSNGTFSYPDAKQLGGFPVGPTSMSLSAPGYEPKTVSAQLLPGRNSIVATLSPTVEVVAQRASDAILKQDYRLMWDILNPTLRRQYRGGRTEYISSQTRRDASGAVVQFKQAKVGAGESVGTYELPKLKKSFNDVWAVPVTLEGEAFSASMGRALPQVNHARMYFVKSEGAWTALGVEFTD